MVSRLVTKEGYVYGEWRKTRNPADLRPRTAGPARSTGSVGSIHNEETAKSVGMRGAVVAGVQHLDLLPPVLLEAFGQKCFENGSMSLYYTYGVVYGEEVRAIVQLPPKGVTDAQVEARVELPSEQVAATGTVSLGSPKEKSYLQSQEIKSSPPEELRILKGLEVGYEMPPKDAILASSELENRLPFLEDTLDWNSGDSPWGNAIIPPSRLHGMMAVILSVHPDAVGFFGATEIRYVNGPVKADVSYQAKGKIIAAGVTSRTEYYWFDSQLYEKDSNQLVAEMRHMTRYMKAGSPLYTETSGGN